MNLPLVQDRQAHAQNLPPDLSGELKDPVCGMAVTADLPNSLRQHGKTIFFCSALCKEKFEARPATYATGISDQPQPAQQPQPSPVPVPTRTARAERVTYTCPMHPELRQDHPGACPKCGMTLEPEMPMSTNLNVYLEKSYGDVPCNTFRCWITVGQ